MIIDRDENRKPIPTEPKVIHAYDVIYNTYGDVVSISQKKKDLRKWGQNLLVGTTKASIMTLPAGQVQETLVSTNAITTVSSSSGKEC
jgi:hypothetical protein